MNMKKILSIMIIFIVTLVISNKVMAIEYREIDGTDRYDIIAKAFSEWMDTFKIENTPEDKRILDYQIGAVGTSESNKDKIKATIEFNVTPFSKENTQWNYTEEVETIIRNGEEFKESPPDNICFLEMTNVDGEYQVDYIAETPEGYDEFLTRFEEYKANLPKTETTETIQGQKIENNLMNQEIKKMSDTIMIGSSIVLIAMISFIIVKFIKYRRKK